MARHPESQANLAIWASWKKTGADKGNLQAIEINAVIASLNEKLRATLEEIYLNGGVMEDHAERLGCRKTVIVRRLSQIDRLLVDILWTKRQQAHESAWMRKELSAQGEAELKSGTRGARSPKLTQNDC